MCLCAGLLIAVAHAEHGAEKGGAPSSDRRAAVASVWQSLCISSLQPMCKCPLRALATAFDALLPVHQPCAASSLAALPAAGGAAGGYGGGGGPSRTQAGAEPSSSEPNRYLTTGEIVARIVLFEMLGPWGQEGGAFDVQLPNAVLQQLSMAAVS